MTAGLGLRSFWHQAAAEALLALFASFPLLLRVPQAF